MQQAIAIEVWLDEQEKPEKTRVVVEFNPQLLQRAIGPLMEEVCRKVLGLHGGGEAGDQATYRPSDMPQEEGPCPGYRPRVPLDLPCPRCGAVGTIVADCGDQEGLQQTIRAAAASAIAFTCDGCGCCARVEAMADGTGRLVEFKENQPA